MKIKELYEILNTISQEDLNAGSDIFDHPCQVAIRATEAAFKAGFSLGYDANADIEMLDHQYEKFIGMKEV